MQVGGNDQSLTKQEFSGEQNRRYTGFYCGKGIFMFGPMQKWGLPSMWEACECVTHVW